ncbi:uncharacterized protein SAPINGB_P005808 [Magnusiomyces paraingens]|uniref:Uncharacterized protein n=1 Tax=Magnusiomyces paraingens TaxID=2606893 RepID=A0A5E8C1Q4_9ASCO|nr:uncharacterized protein SAPINGB_P005808 [Saprochaete ingens]VVT57664.1 unnamed protein product [Saprochaete ingens]
MEPAKNPEVKATEEVTKAPEHSCQCDENTKKQPEHHHHHHNILSEVLHHLAPEVETENISKGDKYATPNHDTVYLSQHH